jgi:hypothetical protein
MADDACAMQMNKLLHAIGLVAALAACAEEKNDDMPASDAEAGTSGGGSSLGGSAGHAGQPATGGKAGAALQGASGQNGAGKSGELEGAGGTAVGGAPNSDLGEASGSGGSAGSAGGATAGSGGAGGVCRGGEACVDYVMPCVPAACTNGHVPYCFCGGGEEPLVECHEGGECC